MKPDHAYFTFIAEALGHPYYEVGEIKENTVKQELEYIYNDEQIDLNWIPYCYLCRTLLNINKD